MLVSQDISESSTVESDNIIVASASATNTNDGKFGQRYVQLNTGGVLSGQFAGGKFITTDDTGEGYTYDVIGNTASGDPSASNFRLELRQPLKASVTSDTDMCIIGSKYANLESADGTDTFLAGVTCTTVTTARPYAWVQTKGVCGILSVTDDVAGASGTLVAVGDTAVASADTAGATSKLSDAAGEAADEQIIGTCIAAPDSSGHGAYYIDID
jgi:hypothetical protein